MLLAVIDYNGIAVLMGAVGVFATTITTAVLQIITVVRQGREHTANARREIQGLNRDKTLETIKTNVNGLNEKIAVTAEAKGKAEGLIIGAAIASAKPPTGEAT